MLPELELEATNPSLMPTNPIISNPSTNTVNNTTTNVSNTINTVTPEPTMLPRLLTLMVDILCTVVMADTTRQLLLLVTTLLVLPLVNKVLVVCIWVVLRARGNREINIGKVKYR